MKQGPGLALDRDEVQRRVREARLQPLAAAAAESRREERRTFLARAFAKRTLPRPAAGLS